MENRLGNVGPTGSRVVVALFGQTKQVSDAVADLTNAGFAKYQIRVAFADEAQQNHAGNGNGKPSQSSSNGSGRKAHTLRWRLRRSFELDLHRSGREQLARKGGSSLLKAGDQYSKVNLHETLLNLCKIEDRIRLLKSEIGPSGALVVVDADDRWNEAESILARVAGKIRTDTATERPGSFA
jgi:hypothetical protein